MCWWNNFFNLQLNTYTSLDYVKQLDKEGKIKRNLTHGILKDTVAVPNGGYTVVRFVANNPGMAIKLIMYREDAFIKFASSGHPLKILAYHCS